MYQDTSNQQVWQVTQKVGKLTLKALLAILRAIQSSVESQKQYSSTHGRLNEKQLNDLTMSTKTSLEGVKLQDREQVAMLTRDLEKAGIAFHAEQNQDKTYQVTFSGRNLNQVNAKLDKILSRYANNEKLGVREKMIEANLKVKEYKRIAKDKVKEKIKEKSKEQPER